MDIDVLRVFIEVMRRGNFAAVARDRDVDPSSISRAVAGLEDELGVRLFHRTTRRLSPTEAGVAYFGRIEPLVEELERARLKAIDIGEQPTGTLRIAAPVSFGLLNLVPLLPEFGATYPRLAFDLVLTDAALDLVEERIDVALRLGPLTESGLVTERLTPMVTRVCASPSYLDRHGKPGTPADLVEHDCLVLVMPGFTNRWRFRDRNGCETVVEVRGRLRTSNALALMQFALSGMGIVMQARWIVGRELRRGTLVDIFPDHEATAAAFESPAMWLLYPSQNYLPLKMRVFLAFLRDRFAGTPPGDASASG